MTDRPKFLGETGLPVSVPLRNVKNLLYFGSVKVGEPPVEMQADFDTGSTNTWVVRMCRGSP